MKNDQLDPQKSIKSPSPTAVIFQSTSGLPTAQINCILEVSRSTHPNISRVYCPSSPESRKDGHLDLFKLDVLFREGFKATFSKDKDPFLGDVNKSPQRLNPRKEGNVQTTIKPTRTKFTASIASPNFHSAALNRECSFQTNPHPHFLLWASLVRSYSV